MNSFGTSESLILAGTYLITSGLVTEGWVLLGLGVFSGFTRFTTYIGQKTIEKD